jgi:hypothetical protein
VKLLDDELGTILNTHQRLPFDANVSRNLKGQL